MHKYGILVALTAASAYAQPAPEQQPPPGSTHATFVSTNETQWDVTLDRQAVCSTPCTLWVEPMRYVTLHSHERSPVRLEIGQLPAGDVMVRAEPVSNGLYATGVTFTALTGMGLVTGITLTAVGFGTDSSGLKTAGLITGIGSAVGLYGSILLMRAALPRAHVAPYVAGTSAGIASTW